MFDFLDEVPDEQRCDTVVSRLEQGRIVVEHQFEHRGEGGLQVGGVGEPIFQGGLHGEAIEFRDYVVEGLLEPWVSPDQTIGVLAVGGRMLPLLTHERVRLFGDRGIGYPRHGLANHIDDHLLEADGQEGHRVGHGREGRILFVPQERYVVVRECESHLSDL